MSLGEEYQELRRVWIDNMLSEALEEIDTADSNFPSRARTQNGELQPGMPKEETNKDIAVIG